MKSDKKSTKIIFTVLIVFFATVFVVCGIMLINSLTNKGYSVTTWMWNGSLPGIIWAGKPVKTFIKRMRWYGFMCWIICRKTGWNTSWPMNWPTTG